MRALPKVFGFSLIAPIAAEAEEATCYARADTGETGCESGAEHADTEAGGVAGGFGDCGGCDVSVGCGNLNCADREA